MLRVVNTEYKLICNSVKYVCVYIVTNHVFYAFICLFISQGSLLSLCAFDKYYGVFFRGYYLIMLFEITIGCRNKTLFCQALGWWMIMNYEDFQLVATLTFII